MPLKRLLPPALLLLACLVGLAPAASATLYTWVDAQGVKHIDSEPPPKGARVLNIDGEPVAGAATGAESQRRYPKVELYATDWCPSCKRAKAYLESRHIPFTAYNVDRNREASKRLAQLNPARTIPTAVIGDAKIVGFDQAAYERALGIRK
jgi:glutaredoxin